MFRTTSNPALLSVILYRLDIMIHHDPSRSIVTPFCRKLVLEFTPALLLITEA